MTAPTFPDPTVYEASKEHVHTIILLHGRGSTGPEFASELFESQGQSGSTLQQLLPHHKWVFLSAQSLYSHTFREEMSQWYDYSTITDLTSQPGREVNQLRESVRHVEGVVERERALVPSGRVVLGGISQGFSVAVLVALMDARPYEALVGYASWLPYGDGLSLDVGGRAGHGTGAETRLDVSAAVSKMLGMRETAVSHCPPIPIFVSHNVDDEVVEVEEGRKMCSILRSLGHAVEYLELGEGGHWISEPDGIDYMVKFLKDNGL